MGVPAFFALIFLLFAAVELDTPTAFGQTGEQLPPHTPPTLPINELGVGQQAVANPQVRLTQEPNLMPQPEAQPILKDGLCNQLDYARDQAATIKGYGDWLKKYVDVRSELQNYEQTQEELVNKIRMGLKDSDTLKKSLGNYDGKGGDKNGGRVWSMLAVTKASLASQIRVSSDQFKNAQGWWNNSDDLQGKDMLVASYQSSVLGGFVTTIRVSDTVWGPQLLVDTYQRSEDNSDGTPAMVTTVSGLFDSGRPKQFIRTRSGTKIPKGVPTIDDYLSLKDTRYARCVAKPAQAQAAPLALQQAVTTEATMVTASAVKREAPAPLEAPFKRDPQQGANPAH